MTPPIAKKEPALIISFIMAVLGLAASFGFHLTDEQMAGIYTVLMLGAAVWTRSVVYSPATIDGAAGMVKALAEKARRRRKGIEDPP
jgi:hypothetical protein